MRSVFAFAVTALFALSLGAAHAQMAPSTPIPAPKKPAWGAVSFLVGSWSCWSKSSRRATPIKYTMTYAPDSSGYWLVGKGSSAGASWYPHASTSTDMYTYDFDTKRWVDVYTDSLGNYDLNVSKGFSGGKIMWHSLAFAPSAEVVSATDSTFTKVSANKTTQSYSFMTGKGKKVSVTGACTRS